ncbi:hypothetical protein [Mycobacteroides salmoniphilum]|nr:hypothetical protein [Mycobacteroides salmoniphilum]
MDDGSHATVSVAGEITVFGCQHGWRLSTEARWRPRRLYRTPWTVAAVTADDDILALNLATVDITNLPAALTRPLHLQALQFCSTPASRWRSTAHVPATFTHDSYLLIGGRKIPVKRPLQTDENVYGTQLEKTFHYLSPKPRKIAQLLEVHNGLTLEQLIEHFDADPRRRPAVKNSLHTELVRMRKHPKITLCHHPDGRYTITRKTAEKHSNGSL